MGCRALFGVVVLLLLTVGAQAGKPEDEAKQKARTEYLEAMKTYNLGEYQQALDHFKEAYRNYPDGSFLFNIGQCQRSLGLKLEAVRSYRAYLRDAKTGRAEVEQIVAGLEKAIAEEQAAKNKTPTGMMGTDMTASTSPPAATFPTSTPPPKPVVVAEPKPKPVMAEPEPRTSAPTAASVTTAPAEKKPIYKKGWFWGVIVGVVVVAGVGAGVGIALSGSKTTFPTTSAEGGTFRF